MRVRRLSCLGLVAGLSCCAVGSGAADLAELAGRVDAEAIRRHVVVLGSDALEGRAPGTRGGDRAASYIAAELGRLDVVPFGEATDFLQPVPLHGSRPRPGCRLTLSSLGESETLTLGDDYLLVTTGEQTLLPRPTPMVFVGYGIVAPEFDYNDYAEVDVRGKVVVFLDGEPASDDPGYFGGAEPTVYSALETKLRIALSRGAVASVALPPPGADQGWWTRRRRAYSFEHVTPASTVPRHLSVILHPSRVAGLFAEALYDAAAVREMERSHSLRSFHLPVQLSFVGEFATRSFLSPNVVAVLVGADPGRRDEVVVVSAHYDHLGRGPAVAGDEIYNGVADNALGVAGALEIARVLSRSERRPRRSVAFVFTTAEEAGNLGSWYFIEHSPVALSDLVADINIDGLAFFEPFDDVVGIGGELSDLGSTLARAVAPLGLEVTPADRLMWSHEAFTRSDQAAFARAGVPSILVSEGFRWQSTPYDEAVGRMAAWFDTRYHSPQDDLSQPLDFSAARRHCGAILALVWTVASSPETPRWKPGVPYAYQRLLSLADEGR